jgi:hypothetical protein
MMHAGTGEAIFLLPLIALYRIPDADMRHDLRSESALPDQNTSSVHKNMNPWRLSLPMRNP